MTNARKRMIVVVDTNVILSGIAKPTSCPRNIYGAWTQGDFDLATCEQQLEELRNASRKAYFSQRVKPHMFGQVINALRGANFLRNIPRRHSALDPTDSFLLDLASAASADYLVTGDKRSGLLQQGRVGTTRILTPSDFCTTVLKLKL